MKSIEYNWTASLIDRAIQTLSHYAIPWVQVMPIQCSFCEEVLAKSETKNRGSCKRVSYDGVPRCVLTGVSPLQRQLYTV